MNDIHISGRVRSVWQYEGDTYVRLHMDPHRHTLGGRPQDQIVVRIPPHAGVRVSLTEGRHLECHGWLESGEAEILEEELRRRLRRSGSRRRSPNAVEQLIDDTPATVRRLSQREELRLVAERIEEPPRPRGPVGRPRRGTGADRRNGARPPQPAEPASEPVATPPERNEEEQPVVEATPGVPEPASLAATPEPVSPEPAEPKPPEPGAGTEFGDPETA